METKMISLDYSLPASIKAARMKPTKGKTMTIRQDYTPATQDGLEMYRKTGGDRRWGKGISQADYKKLSTEKAMARAEAIRAGKPWPSAAAPTRRQQFAEWARIGRKAAAK
jgi:hypothetical protein